MSQQGKTALITGASAGIGEEFARIHAAQSGDLILVARREDRLMTLKADLEAAHGIKVTVIAQDLADPAAPQAVYDAIAEQGVSVDYLINNAGLGGIDLFHQQDQAVIEAQLAVNIAALTRLTRLFLPDFVARGSGRVLNVSSTASLIPGPAQAVYYATKAYVTSFSNAIAQELDGTGVTVTNLMPGATQSEFGAVSGMDKTRLFDQAASAAEVAQGGYDAMLRGDLNVFAGVTSSLRATLWASKILPKKMLLRAVFRAQKAGIER